MKTMLVTYNAIRNIPVGRYEKGQVVVYSGDYGRAKYISFIPQSGGLQERSQHTEAEAKVAELASDLATDVQNIDAACVYVGSGSAAMDGAMALIRDLRAVGKKVTMVAC